MKVIVISKTSFNIIEYNNVTSVTKSGTNIVVNDGTAHTYAIADYAVRIISE